MEKIEKNPLENFEKNFPTSELETRHCLGRAQVSNRLSLLFIKTYRIKGQGNKAYITQEQLRLVDALDAYLKANGNHKIEDFVQERIATGEIVPFSESKAEPEAEPELEAEAEVKPELEPKAESESESNALITQEQAQALVSPELTALDEQVIEMSIGAVAPDISEQEFDAIDQQAQYLAAGRYVATQDLADYYAQTGNFTIPEVVQRIKQRRSQTSAHWEQAHSGTDPNALTQLLIQRAKRKAAGVTGTPVSA